MSDKAFYTTLNSAIDDVLEYGFDSVERIAKWVERLKSAAPGILAPEAVLVRRLKDKLTREFKRETGKGQLLRRHKGVSEYTLARVKPALRAELDRHLVASVSLISLNRKAKVQEAYQRFAGWATSVPKGGTDAADRKDVKAHVRKGIAALPFEERRVIIDQGHKLVAGIGRIVATDGGAIAAIWHHVPERAGYAARPDHERRDGEYWVIRDSWAYTQGLIKPNVGFTDSITQPGEEVYCSCWYTYVYNLRDLPENMLTAKGKLTLLSARKTLSLA